MLHYIGVGIGHMKLRLYDSERFSEKYGYFEIIVAQLFKLPHVIDA